MAGDLGLTSPRLRSHLGCFSGKDPGGCVAERMYLIVAGAIAVAIAGDVFLNEGTLSLFLVRKLIGLVEYLEFWR